MYAFCRQISSQATIYDGISAWNVAHRITGRLAAAILQLVSDMSRTEFVIFPQFRTAASDRSIPYLRVFAAMGCDCQVKRKHCNSYTYRTTLNVVLCERNFLREANIRTQTGASEGTKFAMADGGRSRRILSSRR